MDWVQWYCAVVFFLGLSARCVLHGETNRIDCRWMPLVIALELPGLGRIFGWW